MNINKFIVIGRICNDVELKYSKNSNNPFIRLTVATNKRWKDANGEKQEETSFHNIQFWNDRAEIIAKWFNKGDEIYVEGRMRYSIFEKDGTNHYQFQLIGEKFDFGQKADKNIKDLKPKESIDSIDKHLEEFE